MSDPLAYWTRRLDGATPVPLVADWSRDTTVGRVVHRVETPLPADVLRRCDGDPASLVLAALFAVLHRHTGERDLAVGFETDLIVRVTVDPAAPFADLVELVARTLAEARRHASLSLADLFQELDLLDVFLPAATDVLGLRYNASRLSQPSAERLVRHCVTLLGAALNDSGAAIAKLPVETEPAPAGRWSMPIPDGYTEPPAPREHESLVDRFRAVAAVNAQRLAVRGPSGAYTYADLDRLSDSIARRCHGYEHVALLSEHDTGAIVGIWSALKAAAAYVPLDPRHPDGRLAQLASDGRVDAVLCDPHLIGRATALAAGRPVIPLAPDPAYTPVPLPSPPAQARAYLLYTSGSTGTPKAVVQSQEGVLAHALTYAARVRIGAGDRIPLLARYIFDAAVMDIFGALLTGASLHCIDPYTVEPRTLWSALAAVDATVLHCTPTLFRHLAAAAQSAADVQLTRVRAVVLGGEEVTRRDLHDFAATMPSGCVLVNGYGPTECTVALQHLARPADHRRAVVPVGHPVPGVEVELVDEDGRTTEVFGELVVRSPQVALGYWNRPDQTKLVFQTAADGVTTYHTGDLMYRLPDGAFVFAGRKDQQVKIRGFRVEPAEAETLLRAHPTVGRAAVVVDRQGPSGPRLIGYVTSPAPMPAEPDELRAYLARHLPDYLVPADVVVLDALPVGPTGKLDRSRLPAPPARRRPGSEEPRTPMERRLAELWCEVLGHESVDVRDDFLLLGGDSQQVMTLLGRLDDLGIRLSLLDFLAAPTIESVLRQHAGV